MENQLVLFISTLLTAVAVENVVFARALGLSKPVMFLGDPKTGWIYGALLTWMLTLTSLLTGTVNVVLEGSSLANLLTPLCYLLCVCGVYTFTYLFARAKLPALFVRIGRALPAAAFNSALFGVFYIANLQKFGILQTVGYGIGAGIGYTLAIIIIHYARKRLAISPIPRSFRGLPILLLYIGFLSLAIYGLIGHGLPT